DGTEPQPANVFLTTPPRRRDKEHLKFVAKQACLLCGRQPCDPHHLRFAQSPTLGRKVSAEYAVPLFRLHHRGVHRAWSELSWWERLGIEPLAIAAGLWNETHPKPKIQPVIQISKNSQKSRGNGAATKPSPGSVAK